MWVLPEVNAPRVQRVLFDSKTAGQPVSCHVFTPESYDTEKERRFPVLYWLHGSGGSTSAAVAQIAQRYGEAMRAGKIPPMIMVFPNGLPMGMWCDWKDGSVKLETMFIEELIPHIDRSFRTQAKREGRIIEGFSMAGMARRGWDSNTRSFLPPCLCWERGRCSSISPRLHVPAHAAAIKCSAPCMAATWPISKRRAHGASPNKTRKSSVPACSSARSSATAMRRCASTAISNSISTRSISRTATASSPASRTTQISC